MVTLEHESDPSSIEPLHHDRVHVDDQVNGGGDPELIRSNQRPTNYGPSLQQHCRDQMAPFPLASLQLVVLQGLPSATCCHDLQPINSTESRDQFPACWKKLLVDANSQARIEVARLKGPRLEVPIGDSSNQASPPDEIFSGILVLSNICFSMSSAYLDTVFFKLRYVLPHSNGFPILSSSPVYGRINLQELVVNSG